MTPSLATSSKTDEARLVQSITNNQKSGKVSVATLQTDDRVLARITDGIYRQPASALRELISNAYDADAMTVVIQTDAPRFDQITVRDDGVGMDIRALSRLIHHIGGSSKRRNEGAEFGTSNKKDPSRSPGGRRLIGKIGIGLFSVAQLTRHFQIVTKVKGANYRLVAEVILKTYTEEEIAKAPKPRGEKVETGTVRIVSVHADDIASHGTDIILMNLRPQAKELLQSKVLWEQLGRTPEAGDDSLPMLRRPSYHIGRLASGSKTTVLVPPRLPWKKSDAPEERFRLLYQAILDEQSTVERNPRLETSLDNYLRMLWTLSLASPVDYIEDHPFDVMPSDELTFYQLSVGTAGPATRLKLAGKDTVRKKLEYKAPERGSTPPFRVLVDDVELRRPIRFDDLPETAQAIKTPLLFVGRAEPDLSKVSDEERGGSLAFEAYFLWAPKIVPKENNGLLIRISDASGTLFDDTFAKYQVSELTRLKQITAEIFVLHGLDAALNIDRESFNTSHPHFQYIARWVHRALRQIANTLKQLASVEHEERAARQRSSANAELSRVVRTEVARAGNRSDSEPSDIDFQDGPSLTEKRKQGQLALSAQRVFAPLNRKSKQGKNQRGKQDLFRKQIRAVAQVLDAYGLLEDLTYEEQEEVLRAIVAIFAVGTGA